MFVRRQLYRIWAFGRSVRRRLPRKDHPGRNDEEWMKHTFSWLDAKGDVRLAYRPVTITRHQPEERKY